MELVDRLREIVADVDPALLSREDRHALIELVGRAMAAAECRVSA